MKTCAHCGEAKPRDQFNLNRRCRDGLDHRCKPCHRQASKVWQRGKGKAAHAEAVKAWSRRNPELRRAMDQRMRDKYPLHWRARRAVRAAVIDGRLVRPDACQRCSEIRPVQAHHWRGYEPEAWLDVEWLCTRCHKTAHRSEAVA